MAPSLKVQAIVVGEGGRRVRWLVGLIASAVRKQKRDRVGARLLFSLPNFYFIQDPSSRFDAEMP